MSLPIPTLQSLISRNRAAINRAHSTIDFWKVEAKDEVSLSYSDLTPDFCYTLVTKNTKEIAKLSKIQCSLKKELAYALTLQRADRLIASGWLATSGIVPDIAQRYEAVKLLEGDAKAAGMSRADEV